MPRNRFGDQGNQSGPHYFLFLKNYPLWCEASLNSLGHKGIRPETMNNRWVPSIGQFKMLKYIAPTLPLPNPLTSQLPQTSVAPARHLEWLQKIYQWGNHIHSVSREKKKKSIFKTRFSFLKQHLKVYMPDVSP